MKPMETRSKGMAVALLALLSLGGTVPLAVRANAQPPAPRPGGADFRTLCLTPDQARRVRDMHKQINPRLMELERTLRTQRQAIEAMYRNYDLDEGKLRQMNAQMNATQREILEVHMRLQVEMRKILTADQFNKLRDLMQQRRDAMRRRTGPAPAPNAPSAPPAQH